MNPKLNSTVSVVKINEHILEFFLTNTRQQIKIKVENDLILEIVTSLNGKATLEEIAKKYDIKFDDLLKLIHFLQHKGILDNVTPELEFEKYNKYRRVIHFLAEYSHSHEHLLSMWRNIQKSTVLVIGLGAVGSWVACNLVQSGVENLILMDADTVDLTNLHRQFGYSEKDIGRPKIDALEERIHDFNKDATIIKKYNFLDQRILHSLDYIAIDLIINCADQPTVDMTSLWVGEYAMQRGIPHIVGGGYNLHLSLIGQTIIPGKTACAKCFQKSLEEENKIDPTKIKKLAIKNRKVGSFGPMCSLIASMIGMEAVKILSKDIDTSNFNRRGEFDIYSMNIKYKSYKRRNDCEWCGEYGKYYRS